jgi:hypothetical protein
VFDLLVPGAGLEPARRISASADFKSAVSTDFTTRAAAVILAAIAELAAVPDKKKATQVERSLNVQERSIGSYLVLLPF